MDLDGTKKRNGGLENWEDGLKLTTKERKSMKNLNAMRKELAKFKTIDKMTKAELVSVLKEVQWRMFRFSTTLNNATEPDQFHSVEQLKATKKSAYETWFYLSAIGAVRQRYHEDIANGFQCLMSPLSTQRKFLSHTPRKTK